MQNGFHIYGAFQILKKKARARIAYCIYYGKKIHAKIRVESVCLDKNKRVYAAILIGYLILPMPGNNTFEISDFADQSFFLKAAREPRGCFAPSHSDLIEKLFRNIICFLY